MSDKICNLGRKNKRVYSCDQELIENKLLLERIEEDRNHYRQTINAIEDAICVIGLDFRIISHNSAFGRLIKKSRRDISGKRCHKILQSFEKGLISKTCPLLSKYDECLIRDVFKKGQPQKKELTSSDGKRYYKLSAYPSYNKQKKINEAVFIIQNISERKKAENSILHLSQFNKKILENVPISIMVIDRQGRIISANTLAQQLTKKSLESLIGQNLLTKQNFKRNPEIISLYKKLLKHGSPFFAEKVSFEAGRRKESFLNISAVPLYGQEKYIEGAISMAEDVTARVLAKRELFVLNKTLEEKVKQRTSELNMAYMRLAENVDLKDKFMADASHELRTPLAVIQGNMEIALMEYERNGQIDSEALKIIIEETDRMARVISDLKILTEADTKTSEQYQELVDLKDIIQAVTRSLNVVAKKKTIRMEVFCKQSVLTEADPKYLERAIMNLVRNAVRYTDPGGKIKIKLSSKRDWAQISIKDTGIGIPKKDLPYIFERFYRVDKARSRKEGGTGLGLSITKWIIESFGGKISVYSEIDRGSEFLIQLPLAK